MTPFLPIEAISRSQQVRIGGQTVRTGKITFVDLGGLNSVTAVTPTISKTGTTAPGLTASKKYKYVVTATDAFGGETGVSNEVEAETEAGANTANNYNELKLTWNAVPNATKYKVYRTAAGGATGTEVFITETSETKFNDSGQVTAGTEKPPTANNTFYNPGRGAYSPRTELRNHLAIGAVVTVGSITATNLDWAPITGSAPWALTLASEEAKVATATELKQRSTGLYQSSATGTGALTSFVSTSGNEKYGALYYNPSTNKVEGVAGTNEAEGSASVTAVLEKVPANCQLLYLVNTKGTTKVVTNVTSLVPNAPAVSRA